MNYNFTDRVRKVLAMAREEAIRLQHDYVGTEHILLGLIREGDGVASAVLITLNVDLEQVHERVEESVRKGKATIALGELPYTSRAKKVLEFAMAEARDFSHSYVGTEHLLLGLLREEKGIAAQVLNSLGVTLDEARGETLKVLGSSDPATSEPAGIGGGRARTAIVADEPARLVVRAQVFGTKCIRTFRCGRCGERASDGEIIGSKKLEFKPSSGH